MSSIKAPRRKKDENIEFTSFQLTLELRRVISEEEPGDEEAPDELVTALAAHLLLVEGHEDDGVAEAAAGLGQRPGALQHRRHARPVVVEAVREGGGVPVRPHHHQPGQSEPSISSRDLAGANHSSPVLRAPELSSGVNPDQVEALSHLLVLVPELRSYNICRRSYIYYLCN